MPAAARAMEIMLSLQPPHFSSPLPWRRRSHLHGLATPRRVSTVAPAATLETAAPPASLSFPILVNGCTGKMGVAVAEAAASRGLHLVPVSFSSRENLDKTVQIGDTDIQIYGPSARDDVLSSVIDEFTDVVIMDYTAPYSLMLSCIASLVCHFVMGTTGGDRQLLYKSVQDSNNYALISPQMGKQVVAFLAAMEIMAEQFPGAFSGYRLEVQESHQAGKLDISGTAKAVIACFEKLGVSYDMDQLMLSCIASLVCHFVMGTTGGDRQLLYKSVQDSNNYALISPQMGKQVVAFLAAMEIMAEQFPGAFSGYRLEVQESHQAGKLDISGTAKAVIACFEKLGVSYDMDQLMLSCIASLVCHFVMGTTGGDQQLLYKSVQDSNNYALISPQMGKQVVAFLAAMEIMAEQFPGAFSGYRLEVQESHQAGKLDISGTAKAVIACFEKLGVSYDMDQVVQIRDPEQQLEMVGVPEEHLAGHAFHLYHLTSPDDCVSFEFQHNVCGRSIYAEGSVDAAISVQEGTIKGFQEDL